MAIALFRDEVWKAIKANAANAKRRYVAVPYVGLNAPEILPLRKGDVLITNLSETCVRMGSTRIEPIEQYLAKDVGVFNCVSLHAKVFCFDSSIIIGSANLSASSNSRLVEAAVLLRAPKAVSAGLAFIESLATEEVTPAYLRLCKAWYEESANLRKAILKASARVAKERRSRLWLFDSYDEDYEEIAEHLRAAAAQITDRKKYYPEPLLWSKPPSFTLRDRIIIAHRTGKRLDVYPPVRFLHQGVTASGATVVYVEQHRRPTFAKGIALRRLVAKAFGPRRGLKLPTRQIPPKWEHAFLTLWPVKRGAISHIGNRR